jgi:hypothetical protein
MSRGTAGATTMLVQLPTLSSTLVTLSTWRWYVSPLCYHAVITYTSAHPKALVLGMHVHLEHCWPTLLTGHFWCWPYGQCSMSLQCTQHGGDDYDKIVKGDPGIESIYNWTSSGPTVGWRGATGKGDGVHVLTG